MYSIYKKHIIIYENCLIYKIDRNDDIIILYSSNTLIKKKIEIKKSYSAFSKWLHQITMHSKTSTTRNTH